MLLLKSVKVTNKSNVVVQIPKSVAATNWALKEGDNLEVMYDESTKQLVIKPRSKVGS
ncbi:hypothetical protein D3C79_516470 [compost metagenome]